MTSLDRFDRTLGAWLDADAPSTSPDYLDDVLLETGRMGQRPAWTFPERWLPVQLTMTRVRTPSYRWLALAAILLIAALAAAIVVGSHRGLPAFPVGRNGAIAFSADGDLRLFDPATKSTRLLLGGPTEDSDPLWSPDGTLVAFARTVDGSAQLFVVRADGSGATKIGGPMFATGVDSVSWSPDSRRVAYIGDPDERVHVASASGGSDAAISPANQPVDSVAWRPDGQAVLVRIQDGALWALATVGLDGSVHRLTPADGCCWEYEAARWSPDGQRIAFHKSIVGKAIFAIHVINADGTNDTIVSDRSTHSYAPDWSPDGTRILYYANDGSTERFFVVPADGSSPPVATGPSFTDAQRVWAPDGSGILAEFDSSDRVYLLDPLGGPARDAGFASGGGLTWQRLQP